MSVDEAMIGSLIMSVTLFAAGLGLSVLASMMKTDRLPPNSWAGIRTRKSGRDDATWYAVQRRGSKAVRFILLSWCLCGVWFLADALILGIPGGFEAGGLAYVVLSIIGIVWMAVASFRV